MWAKCLIFLTFIHLSLVGKDPQWICSVFNQRPLSQKSSVLLPDHHTHSPKTWCILPCSFVTINICFVILASGIQNPSPYSNTPTLYLGTNKAELLTGNYCVCITMTVLLCYCQYSLRLGVMLLEDSQYKDYIDGWITLQWNFKK